MLQLVFLMLKATNDRASLVTPNATRGDTGKYTIRLRNASGVAEADVNVTVLGKVSKYLQISSNLRFAAHLLHVQMFEDAPSSPAGPLEATDVTADAITLKWQPPADDGGAPVERYLVEKRAKGSDRWSKVPGLFKDCEAQAKNLDEGQEYEFRVVAVNEHGQSKPLVTMDAIKAKHPFSKTHFRQIFPILFIVLPSITTFVL